VLEDLVALAERRSDSGEADELEVLARRLLDVYRGPLFADDVANPSFAEGPRNRLAAKFQRAARLLGKALEAAGRFQTAEALSAPESARQRC
jgi:hypothetical protein